MFDQDTNALEHYNQLNHYLQQFLSYIVSSAVTVVNDMSKDDVKWLSVDNVYEQSVIMLTQLLDPVNDKMSENDVPDTLKKALREIINTRVNMKFS